jgi:hypothetical protein
MGGERKLLRGHYNPVNWTRKYPNLQWGKIDGKRALLCTNCMRTLHKPPHVHVRKTATKTAVVAAK